MKDAVALAAALDAECAVETALARFDAEHRVVDTVSGSEAVITPAAP
ncbi:hypothetical protein [Streptomyces rubrogriseus]